MFIEGGGRTLGRHCIHHKTIFEEVKNNFTTRIAKVKNNLFKKRIRIKMAAPYCTAKSTKYLTCMHG